MNRCRHPIARGFTLIELLVVISIIALLIAVLLPALGASRRAARASMCLSSQRQCGAALLNYSTEHAGRLMPYVQDAADGGGLQWWFGYEPGGPQPGTGRPLDKTRGPLADYLGGDIAGGLACPEFPRGDVGYVAKFAQPSAHFGYNGGLCWPRRNEEPRRLDEIDAPAGVFAFADAIHQDFSLTQFYEPHAVSYRRPGKITGAGHFRHSARANLVYLDGHAAPLAPPLGETVWIELAASPVANVDIADGPGTRYGFATWTAEP